MTRGGDLRIMVGVECVVRKEEALTGYVLVNGRRLVKNMSMFG